MVGVHSWDGMGLYESLSVGSAAAMRYSGHNIARNALENLQIKLIWKSCTDLWSSGWLWQVNNTQSWRDAPGKAKLPLYWHFRRREIAQLLKTSGHMTQRSVGGPVICQMLVGGNREWKQAATYVSRDSFIMELTCMVDHKGREMQAATSTSFITSSLLHSPYHIAENNTMITITNNIFVFTICLFTLILTSCLFQDVFTAVIVSFLLPPYLIILYILLQQATHILLVIRYLFPSPVATAKDDLKTFCTGTTQSNLVSPVVPSPTIDSPTPEVPLAVEELPPIVKRRFGNFYDYGKERQRTSTKYLPIKNKYDVPLEPYTPLRPTGIDGMLEDLRRAQREQKALSLPMPPTPPTSPALLPSPSPEAPATLIPRTISSEDKLTKSEEQCRDSSPGAFSQSIFCSEGFAQCPGFDTSSTPSTHSEQINSEEISQIQCVADQEPLSLVPPFTFVADPIAHGLRVYSSGPLGERAAVDDAAWSVACDVMQGLSIVDELEDLALSILQEIIPDELSSSSIPNLPTTSNDEEERVTSVSPAVIDSSSQDLTSMSSEDHLLTRDFVAVQDQEPSEETLPSIEPQPAALTSPEEDQALVTSNEDLDVPIHGSLDNDVSFSASPINPISEVPQPLDSMAGILEDEPLSQIPEAAESVLCNLEHDTQMVDVSEFANEAVNSALQNSNMDITTDISTIVSHQDVEMAPATSEGQQMNFHLIPADTLALHLHHQAQVFSMDHHEISPVLFPTEAMNVDQHDVQGSMTCDPATFPAMEITPFDVSEAQDSEMPYADPDMPMTSDLPIIAPITSAPAPDSQTFLHRAVPTSHEASIPVDAHQVTIVPDLPPTTCQPTPELESSYYSFTTVPTLSEEDTSATSSHEVTDFSIIQEGTVDDSQVEQPSTNTIDSSAVYNVAQEVLDGALFPITMEQPLISHDEVTTSKDVAPTDESSQGVDEGSDQFSIVPATTYADNTEQPSSLTDPASCSPKPESTTIIKSRAPEEGGEVFNQPPITSAPENQEMSSIVPAAPVEPHSSGLNTTTSSANVTPPETPASKPVANFLRSSATPVKRNGFFFKAPAGQPRAKDSLAAKARMATAQIALGRSGKKDVKSMLAAASDEIVGSSKSRNNDGAGPSSFVSAKTSTGSFARSSGWMQESSYLDDEDDSASEDDTSMFSMGTSTSGMITINKVEVSKSALDRFKSKVISRRKGYKYASEEFVNEVVQKAMQECGVEGLIWQMATNDPLACDSTTRRDQRWYLRWAISKFNLAPEINKPVEGDPEIGEEGSRRVVGLRKGRLASVALEETSNVKRHALAHNSGDA